MKYSKFAFFALLVYSVTTFLNAISLYFLPYFSPLSNFLVLRTMFIAYAEKKYIFIIIALLINIIFFISVLHIKNGRKIFPTISLIILFLDLTIILVFLFEGIVKDGYFSWFYVPHIIVDLIVIINITQCTVLCAIKNHIKR